MNNLRKIFETEEYEVFVLDGSVPNERVVIVPRNARRDEKEVLIRAEDCKKFMLAAILLVKNGIRVMMMCLQDSNRIENHDSILLLENRNDNTVIIKCGEYSEVLENKMTLDNILKLVNYATNCRDRENTTVYRI